MKNRKTEYPRSNTPGFVPLERALSKLGLASRTEARRWICAGRVSVDGNTVTDPGHEVVPERARIEIDGGEAQSAARIYVALHKPRGVVTTRSDPEGRPTVYQFLSDVRATVMPIGRLDLASTGLLLFSNDSRFSSWLTDPASAVSRVYLVTVRGELDDATAARLTAGLEIDGEALSAKSITVRKRSKRETHLVVELVEGRNREIRRLLAAVGHEVSRLRRVSIGGIELGELAPGCWREISKEELARAFPGAPTRTDSVSSPDRRPVRRASPSPRADPKKR